MEWITTKKFYNLVMYNISPNSSSLYKVTDMGLILVRVLKNWVIIETGVYQQNYTGVEYIHWKENVFATLNHMLCPLRSGETMQHQVN